MGFDTFINFFLNLFAFGVQLLIIDKGWNFGGDLFPSFLLAKVVSYG